MKKNKPDNNVVEKKAVKYISVFKGTGRSFITELYSDDELKAHMNKMHGVGAEFYEVSRVFPKIDVSIELSFAKEL